MNNKGHILYNQEKYDEAIVCYDKAIGINSTYTKAIENRKQALAKI